VKKSQINVYYPLKPVNAGVATLGNVNKNVNLNSVKANISVKELGVGVKSIKEKTMERLLLNLKT